MQHNNDTTQHHVPDGGMWWLQARVPVRLRVAVRRKAEEQGISQAKVVQAALDAYLGADTREVEAAHV